MQLPRSLLGPALFAAACSSPPTAVTESLFHAASIRRHFDGRIEQGLLVAKTTIHDVPCRGWVRLLADGRLGGCELAGPTTIQGHALPAASSVWFDDDGRLLTVFLACDTTLQGHACRGGPWQIPTSFHPNGNLRTFVPCDPVTIDGVPCAATTQAPVHLHEDGRLASCRVAADVSFDGRQLRRGDTVRIDGNGKLEPLRH